MQSGHSSQRSMHQASGIFCRLARRGSSEHGRTRTNVRAGWGSGCHFGFWVRAGFGFGLGRASPERLLRLTRSHSPARQQLGGRGIAAEEPKKRSNFLSSHLYCSFLNREPAAQQPGSAPTAAAEMNGASGPSGSDDPLGCLPAMNRACMPVTGSYSRNVLQKLYEASFSLFPRALLSQRCQMYF